MKTLSNDITLQVETTGIPEGYVSTKIYADGIGVFSGLAYIPGDNSSLAININDIASQNRGKYDYLKLNDDGLVETVPLVNDAFGTYSYQRRWNRGQIGNYKVSITYNNTYEDSEYVLTGYDYPNRDLKPTSMDEEDSSLCRIMQGCDWIYNHDEEIGNFQNLLLPHYPYVATDKYGFGLQIGAGNTPLSRPNTPYSIRRDMGPEIELGSPIYGLSNTTFLTLKDLINGITGSNDNDSDVSIYLKQSGTSGDEFGDWEEGFERYKGHLSLDGIQVSGFKDGVETDLGEFDEGATFRVYVTRYIGVTQCGWNLDALMAGDRDVYITDWERRTSDVYELMDVYEDNYGPYEIPRSSIVELQYDRLIATPVYTQNLETETIPDRYYGKCPVAIFDHCYSRYYLAWMDRYGDVQSLAFDGKIEYSENIENIEMQDYKLRRRPIQKLIQPKWKLNTKWLSEYIYPMYEAMFTSPYLLLYDTQTDRSWNVILTDTNYKEKTHKTEKSLFNLEITLEANKKQNYIF